MNILSTLTKQAFGLAGMALTLAGCVTTTPEKASISAQPSTAPVRTITSFSPSLSCMDELFLANEIKEVLITSSGIPDATGRIGGGTKDMLISAVSRMSIKSNAFIFVDFEQSTDGIASLHELVGIRDEFRVPNYYIRGAITQLDSQVQSGSANASLAIGPISLGGGRSDNVSLIAVDMNVAELVTRQILHGVSASNSIAIRQEEDSANGGASFGSLGKGGLAFNVALGRNEGFHQATRTLIELSAIELMGKLAQVPYWQCLQIEQTNPDVIAEVRNWYDSMNAEEMVRYAQRYLRSAGYLQGAEDGQLGPATRNAISRFQADHDLIADGRVSFDFYYKVIGLSSKDGLVKPVKNIAALPAAPAKETKTAFNIPLISMTTSRGLNPTYRLGEILKLSVTASKDSYLYCYYQDAKGQIARIFPNRFHPDPLILANNTRTVPGENSEFDIVMDSIGIDERISCYASEAELGLNLPPYLQVADLIPVAVEDLDAVSQAHLSATKERVTHREIQIKVVR